MVKKVRRVIIPDIQTTTNKESLDAALVPTAGRVYRKLDSHTRMEKEVEYVRVIKRTASGLSVQPSRKGATKGKIFESGSPLSKRGGKVDISLSGGRHILLKNPSKAVRDLAGKTVCVRLDKDSLVGKVIRQTDPKESRQDLFFSGKVVKHKATSARHEDPADELLRLTKELKKLMKVHLRTEK